MNNFVVGGIPESGVLGFMDAMYEGNLNYLRCPLLPHISESDVLVAYRSGSTGAISGVPTGWTRLAYTTFGNTHEAETVTKTVTATDVTNGYVEFDSQNTWNGTTLSMYAFDSTFVFDAIATNADIVGTSPVAYNLPSLTTTADNTVNVMFFGSRGAYDDILGIPSAWVEDMPPIKKAGIFGDLAAHYTQETAGPTGTFPVTLGATTGIDYVRLDVHHLSMVSVPPPPALDPLWRVLQADTFDGTGTWFDGDWTQVVGTWERVSGELQMTTVFNENTRIHYSGAIDDNQAVEVRALDDGITEYGRQLQIKRQSSAATSNAGYYVGIRVGTTPALQKEGVGWIASTSTAISHGDLIRLEYRYGTLKLYINGVETGSYNDPSPLTGGAPGIWINAGTSPTGYRFDDLAVYESVGNTIATDDFNRADGGLGANWSTAWWGSFAVASNAAQVTAAGNAAFAYWNADTFDDDQWAEATFVPGSGQGDNAAVMVRASGSGSSPSGYYFTYDPDNWSGRYALTKAVAGTFTDLGEVTGVGFIASVDLRIEVVGTTITGYSNGVEVLSATDSSLTSGAPGMVSSTGATPAGTIDNFSAGDWTATVTAPAGNNYFFDGITPDTSDVYSDGGGSLYVANYFYANVPIWITGVRLWNPSGADSTFLNTDVTVYAYGRDWTGSVQAEPTWGSPDLSKTDTSARTAGTWTEILFDTPLAINAVSSSANDPDSVAIGVQYAGGNYYVVTDDSIIPVSEALESQATSSVFFPENGFPRGANTFLSNVSTWYGIDLVYSLSEPVPDAPASSFKFWNGSAWVSAKIRYGAGWPEVSFNIL